MSYNTVVYEKDPNTRSCQRAMIQGGRFAVPQPSAFNNKK